jgi:hypothetical protein
MTFTRFTSASMYKRWRTLLRSRSMAFGPLSANRPICDRWAATRAIELNHIPGVPDGTVLTASRNTFERGLPEVNGLRFASYGEPAFEAILALTAAIGLPPGIRRISVPIPGADNAELVGYGIGGVMPRTNLWSQSVSRIEIDQRSREARLRFEQADRLLVLSATVTHFWLQGLLYLFTVGRYGRLSQEGGVKELVGDRWPSRLPMLFGLCLENAGSFVRSAEPSGFQSRTLAPVFPRRCRDPQDPSCREPCEASRHRPCRAAFLVALADDAQDATGLVDGGDGKSSGLADPQAAAVNQAETAAVYRIADRGENAPHFGMLRRGAVDVTDGSSPTQSAGISHLIKTFIAGNKAACGSLALHPLQREGSVQPCSVVPGGSCGG